MEKLKKEDIRIMHEGEQIKKAILEKYSSIEEFSKLSNISTDSLNVYFHCKPYGSGRFKTKLTLILDKSYNEMVLDKRQQINKNIELILKDKKNYNTPYDFEVISILREQCIKDNLIEELSKVYRLLSIYYYNVSNLISAIESIKTSIFLIKDKLNQALFISYNIELAKLYSQNDETEKAIKIYSEIKDKIKNITEFDSNFLFEYYYYFGVIFNRNKPSFARNLFEQALLYSESKEQIGAALTSVGFTYAKQKEYEKAIDYYKIALKKYEKDDKKRIASTYNNMAMAYFYLEKIDNAKTCIKQAFDFLVDDDPDIYFTYLGTHAKVYQSNDEEIIDELMYFLRISHKSFKNKNNIIKAIYEIFSLCSKNKNIDKLDELSDIVEMLITDNKNTNFNEEHDRNLISCYGQICYFIKRRCL